jgi:hypothetical protein
MRGRLSLQVVLCLAVAVLGFLGAPAQAQDVPSEQFSVNRFVPAVGANNYVQLDGAVVGGHMTPSLEALVDFTYRPFVLYDAKCPGGNTDECSVEDSQRDVVKLQLTTNLAGTLTLWQRMQLGLLVPLVYTTGDGYYTTTGGSLSQPFVAIPGGSAFAMGDPRLLAKFRLVGEGGQGFLMAGVLFMTAPLGNATAEGFNVGDDGVTGGGNLAAEYRVGKLRAVANVGANIRPSRVLLATETGPEMTYGLGAGIDLTSLLGIVSEFAGATQFTTKLDENPMEWRVAGRLTQGDFVIQFGGGAGLVSGVGIPNFRLVGGVAYQPSGLDSDNDGVKDNDDSCPAELEDMDGYLDDDGCPDSDNDGDGLEDGVDKCPSDAEDPDGKDDQDGCPDRDNDGDGVQDGYDSCPNEPEDMDKDRDEDGCPDNDRDRDGIDDGEDKCPAEPEDTDGFGDEDGCPEVDFDEDKISDDQDQCPDLPEDPDEWEDEDGCPEEGGLPLDDPKYTTPKTSAPPATDKKK